jgi:hypothetical protein
MAARTDGPAFGETAHANGFFLSYRWARPRSPVGGASDLHSARVPTGSGIAVNSAIGYAIFACDEGSSALVGCETRVQYRAICCSIAHNYTIIH